MNKILQALSRPLAPAVFLLSALLAALALQHVHGWQPCPLCILQRLSAIGLIVAIGGWALAPANHPVRTAALGVAALFCGAGAAVGGGQLWVLAFPSAGACGPGLALYAQQLVEALPGSAWLLDGSGACDDARYSLLGLPLAAWSVLAHVGTLSWVGVIHARA